MATIERLEVVFDANFQRLEKKLNSVIRSNHAAAGKIEKAWGKTDAMLSQRFGKNLFSEFEAGLSSAAGTVPVLGSALSGLGTAGIGLTAVLAGLAVGLHQARQAMGFADEIADTADRLHVTTDALQEYRYAVRAAGGEEKGADEALESFSSTLGKAQQGLAKGQRAFKALGFTEAEIKGFKSVEEALAAVADRIAGLGKSAQRDAIIDQLGLKGMKQALDEGSAGLNKLMADARRLGVVMDAGLIARAAEAQDEFDTLSKVIDVQLKSAFTDLAPVLIGLIGFMADMARIAGDIADSFRDIENRTLRGLVKQRDDLVAENVKIIGSRHGGEKRALYARNNEKIAKLNAEIASRQPVAPAPPSGNDLLPPDKGGGASGPSAADLRQRGQDALNRAISDELRARASLTDNIDQQAQLRLAEIDAELKAENDRLRADIAAGEINAALAEEAILKNENVASLRRQAVDQERLERLLDQQLADQERISGIYDQIAGITAGLAHTTRERVAIEAKALRDRQRRERIDFELRAEAELARDPSRRSAIDRDRAAMGDLQAAEQKQVFEPIRQGYKTAILGAFEAARGGAGNLAEYFGDQMKAKLLDSLAESIATALVSGGQGGGGLLASAGRFILSALPGFAKGTNSAPGGLAVVGERGRELVNLPKGSQVIPNLQTNALLSGRRQVTVIQPFHFHAEGAVLTTDILNQANSYADQRAQQASFQALNITRRTVPSVQQRVRKLGT